MPSYALLFRGGKLRSELTKEYSNRFTDWAGRVASTRIPGNRFKQEGMLVSTQNVDVLNFNKDMIGGYIVIEANGYDTAVAIAKGCPILENGGAVEVREIIPPGT
jgi:hypothetical protein